MGERNNDLSLTPDEVTYLISDGALDDDNIPEEKSSPNKTPPVSPEKIKVSGRILNNRSRFFGSGTSKEDVVNILSQEGGDFKHPTASPVKSPKRKVSPIKVNRNHPIKSFARNPSKSPSPKRSNTSASPQRSPGSSPSSPKGFNSRLSASPSSPSGVNAIQKLLFSQSPSKQENIPAGEASSADGKYYFDAFYNIIHSVRSDKRAKVLFTEQELGILNNIKRHQSELHLYVRLMNRVDKWKVCSSISYPEIATDLDPLFTKLKEDGYITFDMSKEPLEEVLNLLRLEGLRNLCKVFKLTVGNDTKEKKVERLCKFARTQPTIFSTMNPVRKHAEKELGRCFRLFPAPRLLFRRCLLIFSMFHSNDELDKLSQTQALLLLEVKRQNMVFPISVMEVYQDYHIYDNRDQFLRYEKARELRQEMLNAKDIEKDLDKVESVTAEALKLFQELLSLDDEKNAKLLPLFLRKFRAGSVYGRILESGAEALRTGKNGELAKTAVLALQSQDTYLTYHAGRWAVLLATILQLYCKDNAAAAKELCRGLALAETTTIDRISLSSRAEIILKRKKGGLDRDLAEELRSVLDPPVTEPTVMEVQARSTSLSNPGMKRVYVRHEDGGRVFRSVEEEVLRHFRNLGFNGRHDEGSLVRSLCILSMWDIIYDASYPSVFLSQYQDKPLDWGSREFYECRKKQIEERLEFVRLAGEEGLAAELLMAIKKNGGQVSLVVWDAFENVVIKDVLQCLTIEVFIAICRRLLQDYRSHRSGLPDLTLWNLESKKCLFVEVKGPGDTLSSNQILWLDYLRKHGSEAVVANVRATGSKEAKK